MSAKGEAVLLRCKKDGVPLHTATGPERGVFVFCPVCGSGGQYEEVAEKAAGLISPFLSEEQLVNLREQIRISRNKGG